MYHPYFGRYTWGRDFVEEHLDICLEAGLNVEGINQEVAPGQWDKNCNLFRVLCNDSDNGCDSAEYQRCKVSSTFAASRNI